MEDQMQDAAAEMVAISVKMRKLDLTSATDAMPVKGQHVPQLQGLLNASLVNPRLTIDGKAGDNTKKALGAFQEANRLTKDFIAGKKTWEALLNPSAG